MEKNKKTKNIYLKTKKGFSLLETLVAVSVFSLVSVMLAGSFSGFLKNSISAKKSQRSAEGAQYSMNLMSKTIRTSTLDASSISLDRKRITMFDNSQGLQGACVTYKYENNVLQMATASGAGITGITNCTPAVLSNFSPLTKEGEVSGMEIYQTSSMVGRITILLSLQDGAVVQSSVSLRGQ